MNRVAKRLLDRRHFFLARTVNVCVCVCVCVWERERERERETNHFTKPLPDKQRIVFKSKYQDPLSSCFVYVQWKWEGKKNDCECMRIFFSVLGVVNITLLTWNNTLWRLMEWRRRISDAGVSLSFFPVCLALCLFLSLSLFRTLSRTHTHTPTPHITHMHLTLITSQT